MHHSHTRCRSRSADCGLRPASRPVELSEWGARMKRQSLKRRLISTGGTTLLLWSLTAGAAAAKPLEHEHFEDISSNVIEEFCGDLTVREDVDITGMFLFNPRGSDGIPYGTATVHGSVSWTNLANDKSLTSVFNFVEKDLKITDNADGTFTIRVMNAGGGKVYGPDGKLLFSDDGLIWFEVLIDNGGTPTDASDDEFLEFLGVVKGSTGTNDTEGRDFCDDIHEFIG